MLQQQNQSSDLVKKVLQMFQENYDWDAHYENDDDGDDEDDVFRKAVTIIEQNEAENFFAKNKYYDCGGFMSKNTPNAFYKLIWLCRPKQINLSDLYKSGTLLLLCSKCQNFIVSVETYKYKLGLYFLCKKEFIEGQRHDVIGGWPTADNGVSCNSEDGKEFFSMVQQALETYKWCIYSGDDFFI